jgi:hypothetical protein
MVVFLTSIRHPYNSNNFDKVIDLFTTTLHSICSQTDPDFKFIVVCNQIPSVNYEDPRIIYHVVDFPPPSPERKSATGLNVVKYDKGTKLMSGFLLSRRYNPDYIFIVDSDDWVNIKVVEYLHSQKKYPVWSIDSGYFANYNTKQIKRKYGMTRYCGSTFLYLPSFILKLAKLKYDVDEKSSQSELIAATSETFIYEIMGDHTIGYRYFTGIGVPPKPIPFRAISWNIGTGENHSGTKGGEQGLPIGERFCTDFGLPNTFISADKTFLTMQLREMIGSIRSKVSWINSKITGINYF